MRFLGCSKEMHEVCDQRFAGQKYREMHVHVDVHVLALEGLLLLWLTRIDARYGDDEEQWEQGCVQGQGVNQRQKTGR